MANYKVIYRDESPRWQPGCPLKIEVVQVARDIESQRAFLQMKGRNVSGEVISAVEVMAHVTSSDGQVETVQLSSLDADVAPNGEWRPHARELSQPEVARVDAFVTRAGDETSFEQAIELATPEPLALSAGAARARDHELEEAGIKPGGLRSCVFDAGDWWVCSCGALNVGREDCRECRASKELLLRLENESWLDERDLELRYHAAADALASGKMAQMEWAKAEFEALGDYMGAAESAKKCANSIERKRKKNRKMAVAAIAVTAIIAIAYLVAAKLIIPLSKYNAALTMAEAGEYEEALAELESLNGYGDSAQQIERIIYDEALSLFEDGDYAAAYSTFGTTSYSDAAEMCIECANAQGAALEEEHNYIDALHWYEVADNQDAYNAALDGFKRFASTSGNHVSAGSNFTIGLCSDGTVVATGSNSDGQCDVTGWSEIIAVSAGSSHAVGLRSDGTVVATGSNAGGQCDVSGWTDIVTVSAGSGYTIGLRSDGTVIATGKGTTGSFGSTTDGFAVSEWTEIVAVSAGSSHAVGLRSDGTVVATGSNYGGQCDVSGWTDIVAVSAGSGYTIGLRSDGTVVAAGNNSYSQCDVSGWSNVVAISAGQYYTAGLRSDGTVVITTPSGGGRLSDAGWEDVVGISVGSPHIVGLHSDGTVVAAGDNKHGECDVSDWAEIMIP